MEVREVELAPGAEHRLTLPGLGSAGYVWGVTVEGAPGVVEIDRESVGASPEAPTGSPPPRSYNRDERFRVLARKPGQARVHFAQRRPWEKGKEPLREVVLVVAVA